MLIVGTDCSGIESICFALQNLQIEYYHVFSCEKDKFARASLLANHSPEIIYDDIFERNVNDAPYVDLYVCGFPCQSFSTTGKRQGINDPRGTVVFKCIEYICTKRPKYFILENVKGLLSIDHGETFKQIINELKSLEGYDIQWRILNTRDYGIPQNRERVYIVGSLEEFNFEKIEEYKCQMDDIHEFIDYTDLHKDVLPNHPNIHKMFSEISENSIFVKLDRRKHYCRHTDKYAACITTNDNIWNIPLHRKATISELLKLQGFPSNFKQVVSRTQMVKQIGNAMSVNVLEAILKVLIIQ